MDQIILATGEAPEIAITSVGGDLRLQGWEQNQFQAESDDDHSLTAEQKNGTSRSSQARTAPCASRAAPPCVSCRSAATRV
jgi:hypothetical protein